MISTTKHVIFIAAFGCMLFFVACNTTKRISNAAEMSTHKIDLKKVSGGSSGMEQLSDSSYLVVYDLKNFEKGIRVGLVVLSGETIEVLPIEVDSWGEEGISSDLESICAIPGKPNEFLVAESGNWQGNLGRMFHIQVDYGLLTAQILGSVKFPLLNRNDMGLTGDQYEAIHCLPYSENERLIILGERGGSEVNSMGVLRWGVWDIKSNTFAMEGEGLKGIMVNAPGNWSNDLLKRSITDIHVDDQGMIWASASEDLGDSGPFYSVIYKLGRINKGTERNPVVINDRLTIGKEIYGFKIEALSGPKKGIMCTHTFGTEDEMYGGVWRPIDLSTEN